MIISQNRIEHVCYPVFPPNGSAAEVMLSKLKPERYGERPMPASAVQVNVEMTGRPQRPTAVQSEEPVSRDREVEIQFPLRPGSSRQ
jgi:hypothetical protein